MGRTDLLASFRACLQEVQGLGKLYQILIEDQADMFM